MFNKMAAKSTIGFADVKESAPDALGEEVHMQKVHANIFRMWKGC